MESSCYHIAPQQPAARSERCPRPRKNSRESPTCKNCLVPATLCHCSGKTRAAAKEACARCESLQQKLSSERLAAERSRAVDGEAHVARIEELERALRHQIQREAELTSTSSELSAQLDTARGTIEAYAGTLDDQAGTLRLHKGENPTLLAVAVAALCSGCRPVPSTMRSHPIPSHPISSHPVSCCAIPSHPIPCDPNAMRCRHDTQAGARSCISGR